MSIYIQPRVIHIALDYHNMKLFDLLIRNIDETSISNSDKLGIVMRFHYPHADHTKLTLERYVGVIERLKVDINKTHRTQTLLTDLVLRPSIEIRDKFIDYLLSRRDLKINQPDRYFGFPALQHMFRILWRTTELRVELVKKLLKAGADFNYKNKQTGRNIAQEMIVKYSYDEVFKTHFKYLLFQTNIDINNKDKEGKTALDLIETRISRYEQLARDTTHTEIEREYNERLRKEAVEIKKLILMRIGGGV